MPSHTLVLSALLLAACDSDEGSPINAIADQVEASPADTPTLDLGLTQGYTAADHTEVAPGVFMLTELYRTGEIEYIPATVELSGDDVTLEDLQTAIALGAPKLPVSGGTTSYCYNYDYQNYSERLGRDLFTRGANLYGYANAYSYSYGSTSYNTVYAGAYTYANAKADYVYAYAYVYIEGRYVGYSYQYAQNTTYAYAYGSWRASCGSDLTIDATVYTRNYIYNQDGAYISLGDTFETSAACCL